MFAAFANSERAALRAYWSRTMLRGIAALQNVPLCLTTKQFPAMGAEP